MKTSRAVVLFFASVVAPVVAAGCAGVPHPPTGVAAETIFAEHNMRESYRLKKLMRDLSFIPDEGARAWFAAKAAGGGVRTIAMHRDFAGIGRVPGKDTPCGYAEGDQIHLAQWTLDGNIGPETFSGGALYACLAHEIAHHLRPEDDGHCAAFRKTNLELAREFEKRFPGFLWGDYGRGYDKPTRVAARENAVYGKGKGAGECPQDK